MKTLRRRAIAKVTGQSYESTKLGFILKDCYGSTELISKIDDVTFLDMIRLHVECRNEAESFLPYTVLCMTCEKELGESEEQVTTAQCSDCYYK